MTITVQSSGPVGGVSASTFSGSFARAASTDLLVVLVTTRHGQDAGLAAITTISYGGQALTPVLQVLSTNPSRVNSYVFLLRASELPAGAGPHPLSIQTLGAFQIVAAQLQLAGVHQTNPVHATDSNIIQMVQPTSQSTIQTTVANTFLVDCVAAQIIQDPTVVGTAGPGQTKFAGHGVPELMQFCSYEAAPTPGTHQQTWTLIQPPGTNGPNQQAVAVVAFLDAGGTPQPNPGAIQKKGDAADDGSNADPNPFVLPFAISAEPNRMLFVAIAIENGRVTNPTSSVTYAGTPMRLVASHQVDSGFLRVYIFFLGQSALPSTAGTNNVSVNFTFFDPNPSPTAPPAYTIIVREFCNVADRFPEAQATNGALGTTGISTPALALTDGAWALDVVGVGQILAVLTPSSGQTFPLVQMATGGGGAAGASSTKALAVAGPTTLGWNTNTSANRWVHAIVVFAPAGSADPRAVNTVWCGTSF